MQSQSGAGQGAWERVLGMLSDAPAPKEGKAAKYEESKKRVFSNRDQRGLTDFVQTIIDN